MRIESCKSNSSIFLSHCKESHSLIYIFYAQIRNPRDKNSKSWIFSNSDILIPRIQKVLHHFHIYLQKAHLNFIAKLFAVILNGFKNMSQGSRSDSHLSFRSLVSISSDHGMSFSSSCLSISKYSPIIATEN